MKKLTYQVYDSEGKDRGIVSTASPAEAAKIAREHVCQFPILVLMEGIDLSYIDRCKRETEERIAKLIAPEISRFERETKLQVENLEVTIIHEIGIPYCTHTFAKISSNMAHYLGDDE